MHGHSIAISAPRRLVGDLLHFAAAVPSIPVQRRMRLGELVAARSYLRDRPAWSAIFIKAYARLSAEMPELRRAYVKYPRPRLFEFTSPSASVAIERLVYGEPAVLFARIRNAEEAPLMDLTDRLRELQRVPVSEVKDFRRALRLSRWPLPVRRLAWWLGLNVPRARAKHFGTFGLSVYSALGAESLHPRSPLTTLLNYGPLDEAGGLDVRIVYDHRVLDGATVARALVRLEGVLRGPILEEVRRLARDRSTAALQVA